MVDKNDQKIKSVEATETLFQSPKFKYKWFSHTRARVDDFESHSKVKES